MMKMFITKINSAEIMPGVDRIIPMEPIKFNKIELLECMPCSPLAT